MNLDKSRKNKLEALAKKLGKSWFENSIINGPDASEIPQSREEAFFVQDHMAYVICKDISGWKVGATSKKMRELDGHDDVIPGRIFSQRTFIGKTHVLDFNNFHNAG